MRYKKVICIKSYNGLYERMISDDNIRVAIYSAAKNKRKNNKRHRRLRYIKAHVEEYIPIVKQWILDFAPAQHIPITINDGISAKKREIIVPTVKEILIHHAVIEVIKPQLTRRMYEHSYASIPRRGLHRGVLVTKRWIQQHENDTKYCLKMDIKKFFNSVDQEILLKKLRKIIRDKRYFNYLKQIVRTVDKGIPLGFTTSQWFANFLLTEFDHKVKEFWKIKYYIRFMDDMVIFGTNKRKLHKLRKEITTFIKQTLNLEIKDNWQIFFLDSTRSKKKKGRLLDFLGFKFYRTHMGLRGRLALRAQRKAKRIFKKGKPNIHDARQIVVYAGLIKYANCYHWFKRHIDKFVNIKQMRLNISHYDKYSKGGINGEYMV